MRNFKPTKVVALDDAGQPIIRPISNWTAKYNGRKGTLVLSSGRHRRQYDLATEVLYLAIVDQKDEVDLGKTLGRMALTGIATNGFAHGKGVAGAVMDLAMRGTATNAWLRCEMVLSDLSVVSFEARPEQIKGSSAMVLALGDSARERLGEINDFLRRLKADGERALPELEATIQAQRAQAQQLADDAEHGGDFASRDRARGQLARLQAALAGNEAVRAALIVDFATAKLSPMHGMLGKVMKGLMWIALGFIAFIVFLIYATRPPTGESTQHPPKAESHAPSADSPRQAATASSMSPQHKQSPLSDIVLDAQRGATPRVQPNDEQVPRASKPSFDCAKAATRVEKLICEDPDLGQADAELAGTYRKALAKADDANRLKKEQVAWRRHTRDACTSSRCDPA